MIVDVVVDLQYGDCGKGKVTHSLLKSGEYTHCIRYNGGHNAGHTIIHEGQEIITHIIPAGVLYGVRSIIGPGCVVNLNKLRDEIRDLKKIGIDVNGKLFIDRRTHLIGSRHLEEDGDGSKVGSTKMGNGPAYRDKYDRKGVRASDVPLDGLPVELVDIYSELHESASLPVVLMEGAQGFGLDIDWGDYPYVTSSHCTTAGAMLNGVPPKAIRKVYGVCKAYETYVGTKSFQPEGDIFNKLQEVGKEFGATTGRKRQCNYMNLDLLQKAIRINGVTDLVINKMDVLKEVDHYAFRKDDGDVIKCYDEHDYKLVVYSSLASDVGGADRIKFSYSPEDI
jgi:adenylosuccinate synthase